MIETEKLIQIGMFVERVLYNKPDDSDIRLAVVGSRNFQPLDAVRGIIQSLNSNVVIISGGAKGVDETAIDEAKKCGLKTEVYPADWDKHGKAAGPIRNSLLIEKCDGVIAFWDGVSKGTKDTISKAKKTRCCLVFSQNGTED